MSEGDLRAFLSAAQALGYVSALECEQLATLDDPSTLLHHCPVILTGLTKADLNGVAGVVTGARIAEGGRYPVSLATGFEYDSKTLGLKMANLRPAPHGVTGTIPFTPSEKDDAPEEEAMAMQSDGTGAPPEDTDCCRICWSEASEDAPLMRPCACRGSSAFACET